jgi:hypothetical protein
MIADHRGSSDGAVCTRRWALRTSRLAKAKILQAKARRQYHFFDDMPEYRRITLESANWSLAACA